MDATAAQRAGPVPGVGIRAIGRYVPHRVVTNDELARRLPTSNVWIQERLGIQTRHHAAADEWSSDLGAHALLDACRRAGIAPDEVDLVICGTYTPDHMLPNTAAALMLKAGLQATAGFDINAGGCPTAVFALDVGRRYVESGDYRRVAVVLTDVSSKLFDPEDRTVGVIFGDAAACYLLERTESGRGIRRVALRSEPDRYWSAYAAREPRADVHGGRKSSAFGDNFTTMRGGDIRDFVLGTIPGFIESFVTAAGLRLEDIDFYALHQANLRLVHGVLDALGLPRSKTLTNIERLGNVAGASLPLVLREAVDSGRLRAGHRAVLVAFGAGLNYGAALVDWAGPHDFAPGRT